MHVWPLARAPGGFAGDARVPSAQRDAHFLQRACDERVLGDAAIAGGHMRDAAQQRERQGTQPPEHLHGDGHERVFAAKPATCVVRLLVAS
jgi:hypothetical protein